MNLNNLEQELNDIMEHGLDNIYFPYSKGKSVRIKNVVIRENKTGFLVSINCFIYITYIIINE